MAEPRLVLASQADADLLAITAFIAQRDGPARAMKATERIWKTMRNLAFMPGMGRWQSYLDDGVRAFPIAPWTIYYASRLDGDGIEIVRIIDGRRDLPAVFKKKKPRRR